MERLVTGHSVAVSAQALDPQVPSIDVKHISTLDSFDRDAHELAALILQPTYLREEK